MQPHQERVVVEKKELDEKLEKLKTFLAGDTFKQIHPDEQARLTRQADIMQQYSSTLGDRIAAF